jgi:hypothetical protein
MEVASIKGDNILLMYHPAETVADVGQQFAILEVPDSREGLIVQVITNDSLEYPGLQQEMIQHLLEERIANVEIPIDRERGMGEIKSLKLAAAKIRKRVTKGEWQTWDGWIPTRNVKITRLEGADLLANVVPAAEHPLAAFTRFDETPVSFDGPRLNMVNVITGVKGSGKSHLAKHLLLRFAEAGVPSVVFDINGEYVNLPNVASLRWGRTFVPNLGDVGIGMLRRIVGSMYPFQPGSPSESAFESGLPNIFNRRRTMMESRGQRFTIDISYLINQSWDNNQYVDDAIKNRLGVIRRLGLFEENDNPTRAVRDLRPLFEDACNGRPIVFDMREQSPAQQRALVRSMLDLIEGICERELTDETERYPFVFFEEAHFYVSEETILNVITRGRHIGMASVFVTNTPQKLPDTVFRQLDNLFLLALTHRDDIRNVSRNSFTDEATIESFATRMSQRHAMIVGNVTNRYPLVLSVDPLPAHVPTTGRTRSTWDRFKKPDDSAAGADD